jgi:ATP phosphoribosyltransferase
METLKIAIQKSGRLSEKSLSLLERSGIRLTNGNRKLISVSSNFPIEIIYLRDDDIPQCIATGIVDGGIIGEDVLVEQNSAASLALKLGFAKCRLSLAIPKSLPYTGIEFFQGRRIATSFPTILKNWLDENKISAQITLINGSVEISPSIGLADAVFDIVSSGSTLISNGLREVESIMSSQAVIAVRNDLGLIKQNILNDLLFRIQSILRAENNKYVVLNAPNEKVETIISLIPGIKSPTIVPLSDPNWSAIHSVIAEDDFWNVVQKLKNAGAQGILVIPVDKMII